MINKGIIESNKRKQALYAKYYSQKKEIKLAIRKAKHNNDFDLAFKLCQELDRFPRNASITRCRNRCLLTGRARGLVCYKYFPICAIKLREHANMGYIPGVYKI